MSLQSAEAFIQAVALNPALIAEVSKTTTTGTLEEIAEKVSVIGKREGYDFSAMEAAEARGAALQVLSEQELDTVVGGGGVTPEQATLLGAAASYGSSAIIGQMVPGVGGILGAGVGASVSTAASGGGFDSSIAAFGVGAANALNSAKNEAQSIASEIFSHW